MDADNDIDIIDDTDEARKAFGYHYGCELQDISKEQLDALLNGKCLAYFDGEYAHFLVFRNKGNDHIVTF